MIRIKKSFFYYLLIIVVLLILYFCGNLLTINEFRQISVIGAILELSKKALEKTNILSAFFSCDTLWVRLFLPVLVSIPSASFTSEELKSNTTMFTKSRRGTFRYTFGVFFHAAGSGALISFCSVIIYGALLTPFFPLDIPMDDGEILGLVSYMGQVFAHAVYLGFYGLIMSAVTSLLVLIYTNLYVNYSITLILSFIISRVFQDMDFVQLAIFLFIVIIFYFVIWKFKIQNRRILWHKKPN